MRSKSLLGLMALLLCSCSNGVTIASEVTGRISSITIHKGSYVHIGDVLIQLNTHELLLKRSAIITRIDLTELRHADATGLYRELERTDLDLTRFTITSPADGRIIWLASVRPGDTIHAGGTLVVLR